jgi:hypothetical protein
VICSFERTTCLSELLRLSIYQDRVPENALIWDYKQVVEDEELSFGGGGQLTGSTWKGGFTIANQSVSDQIKIPTDESRKLCTVQKFQQFESFYARLTSLSREYFLPPEIVRFGLITDKSSLPSPDVVNESNSETWFLSVHYVGCTTCSVIAKEGDDLRSLLQSHHNLDVKEVSENPFHELN